MCATTFLFVLWPKCKLCKFLDFIGYKMSEIQKSKKVLLQKDILWNVRPTQIHIYTLSLTHKHIMITQTKQSKHFTRTLHSQQLFGIHLRVRVSPVTCHEKLTPLSAQNNFRIQKTRAVVLSICSQYKFASCMYIYYISHSAVKHMQHYLCHLYISCCKLHVYL